MRLKGKVALVTGGCRGIGSGIAAAFAREGARVAINYNSSAGAASELVKSIQEEKGEAISIQGDVGSAESVLSMIEKVTEEFGRIDILVNSAGTLSSAPVLELDPNEVKRVFETNVFGLFTISQLAAKKMVSQGDGGAILNISSLVAFRPFLGASHYNASKAAVTSFTRSMALELGRYRIRVNELCPASVETDMIRKALQDPENVQMRRRTIPLGRIGTPEDLAGAAVYLCSDEASWITGVSIYTDGGLSVIPPFGPPS